MFDDFSDGEVHEFILNSLEAGVSLSEVQDQLAERYDIHLTYMELRLLTAELQVNWDKQDAKAEAARPKDPNAPKAAPAEAPATDDALEATEGEQGADEALDAPTEEEDELAAAQRKAVAAAEKLAAKTKVEISKVVRPGAQMSGSVTFASGATGEWFVDQMGRLGFEPATDSAKPTQSDMQGFQVALYKQLGY